MKSWKDDPRAATNPLFNDNRLKLGLFGLNAGHQIFSTAADRYIADWPRCDRSVGLADKLGLEAAVSLMGWEHRPEFEPFTWAAALGARHPDIAVLSTLHMQLMHPTFVAKAAATTDHVTAGRFGLNLVAGTNPLSFSVFGREVEDHETRYAHADEWVDLLKRLWSAEAPFSHDGRFYQISNVLSVPKPRQHFPALMNAGVSERGRIFACKHADMAFTLFFGSEEGFQAQIAAYRQCARDSSDRDIQIWTQGYVVIRETEAEANDFLDYYASEHADRPAIAQFMARLAAAPGSVPPKDRWKLERNWAAGGGVALVGTADQVADRLRILSGLGVDGILLNTIEPETLLQHVGAGLLPRLEAMGLRGAKRG